MENTVLVLGATGTVGREVVAGLRRKGIPVRAGTRLPNSPAATRLECELVECDFERPETYPPALAGARSVFLIARPGDEHADEFARPLIDEMIRQGVGHVVNLSAMGADTRDDFSLRKVERYLEESGLEWTHLRPNWFMQIFSTRPLLTAIRATGKIQVPAGDARISFIDARDVAAVATAALTEPGHQGKAYTLTGPDALDHVSVARAISSVTGRAVEYLALSEDQARSGLRLSGMEAERIERLIQFYRLVRHGACAPVSADVPRILGRPPISFAQFAQENASAWA
jgi:uncharacterized protein YbjT (DUF2867 family)